MVAALPISTIENMIAGLTPWITDILLDPVSGLDPSYVAAIVDHTNTIEFIKQLIPSLTVANMAGIINDTDVSNWMGQLVSQLNAGQVANMINNIDSAWMINLMNALHAAPGLLDKLATVANSADFTSFVNDLMTRLNPGQIAGILNTNGSWVGQVVSGVNTGTVVDIINNVNLTWYQQLMGSLEAGALPKISSFINDPATQSFILALLDPISGIHPSTIAGIVNDPATHDFINALLPQLTAANIADVVTDNYAWMNSVVAALPISTIENMIAGLTPWITDILLDPVIGLDPSYVAAIVDHTNTIEFIKQLIPSLTVANMAGIINDTDVSNWMGQLVSQLNAGQVANMINNIDSAWMINLMNALHAAPGLLDKLATVANSADFTSFVNDLMTRLNPGQIAGILNTNGSWVGQVVSGVNTGTVVDIINNVNLTWYQQLMGSLEAGALPKISSFINDPATQSFILALLDPISGIHPSTIAGIVNDPATHDFINALLPQLTAANIADVVTDNYAWMNSVVAALPISTIENMIAGLTPWITDILLDPVRGLDPSYVAAIVDHANTIEFIKQLIPSLTVANMAGIINDTDVSNWMGQLVSQLNAGQVANMINNIDSAWMINLMNALHAAPGLLDKLATVANSADFTSFVNDLMTRLNPGQIAGILNTNGSWVGQVVSGVNTGTVVDIINNVNLTWYQQLMGSLEAGALPEISSFINDPATQSFILALLDPISGIHPSTIAGIVNDPATHDFINALLPQLTAANIADVVTDNYAWMNSVVAALPISTIENMIAGLTPWITDILLDPVSGLDPSYVAAIVDHTNTIEFIKQLIPSLTVANMAGIINDTDVSNWMGQRLASSTPARWPT